MMEVVLESFRAFTLTVSEKKTGRDLVHASTAHTVNDDADRSDQTNLQTCSILHLPRGGKRGGIRGKTSTREDRGGRG